MFSPTAQNGSRRAAIREGIPHAARSRPVGAKRGGIRERERSRGIIAL